ncbi:MAG: response regulator, partial [Saprospiraceae bacterium]|nr:response regulator [Saprospiraceae bacterium]
MNCIIIEDQPPAQRLLAKYIEDFGALQLVGTFSNGLQALDFLRSNPVDLIFLDIHLPKMSGIDFLGALTQTPYVILTTAFPDYALQS